MMEKVKDLRNEVLKYVETDSGDIRMHDLYVIFHPDYSAVTYAVDQLVTDGKIEERIVSEEIGKRLFLVDEKLWRKN